MDKWEIIYNSALASSEVVEAVGTSLDPDYMTLFDEGGSTIWAAPRSFVLSVKKIAEPASGPWRNPTDSSVYYGEI